jgi:uncharacterized protein (TIGR02266 family)
MRILFTRGGTGIAIEAVTDDISPDGVFVRTRRRPPDVGTKLGLLLKLEDPELELMLRGVVAWASDSPADESGHRSCGMGISFTDLDDETRRILTQALDEAEEEADPPGGHDVDTDLSETN